MDKFGQGVQFQYSMLQKNKELNFEGFNRQMLLEMCILSGCDYLQSLPGMGLKKAHASIKRFKSYDKVRMADRVDMHDYSRPKKHEHICTYKHTHTHKHLSGTLYI
jgi:5'-3' exonuclease